MSCSFRIAAQAAISSAGRHCRRIMTARNSPASKRRRNASGSPARFSLPSASAAPTSVRGRSSSSSNPRCITISARIPPISTSPETASAPPPCPSWSACARDVTCASTLSPSPAPRPSLPWRSAFSVSCWRKSTGRKAHGSASSSRLTGRRARSSTFPTRRDTRHSLCRMTSAVVSRF